MVMDPLRRVTAVGEKVKAPLKEPGKSSISERRKDAFVPRGFAPQRKEPAAPPRGKQSRGDLLDAYFETEARTRAAPELGAEVEEVLQRRPVEVGAAIELRQADGVEEGAGSAEAEVIQRISAAELISAGKLWNGHVWIKADYGKRDELIENMNKWIKATGFRVGRGWQPYDPVVRPARKYTAIATDLDQDAATYATAFLGFMENKTALEDLAKPLAELGLITCFAEVGRGYSTSLDALKKWIASIAAGDSNWSDVKIKFDPALTYKEDAGEDWMEG